VNPLPLRYAYWFNLGLRTAYDRILTLRSACRLTTKPTYFGVSIYIKKIRNTVCGLHVHTYSCKRQFCCVCLIVLNSVDPYNSCFVFKMKKMYKLSGSKARAGKKRAIWHYLWRLLCDEKLFKCKTSLYDLTGVFRIAYWPFTYCVPSKHPEYVLRTKRGRVTLVL